MPDPTRAPGYRPPLCAVCSDPVDPETAHNPHEADCPGEGCTCDLWVHPECCPECDR
jgi:hypothetical protein